MGSGATLNITSSGGGGATGIESTVHSHTFSGTTGAGNSKFYRTVANAGINTNYNHQTGYSGGVYVDRTDANWLSADHTHNYSGGTSNQSANHTHTVPDHTHAAGNFSGLIGLVTGGVNGNAAMTSGTVTMPFLLLNYIIKT